MELGSKRNQVLIIAQAFDGDLRLGRQGVCIGVQRGIFCESEDCPLGHNHQVAVGVGGVHRK